MLLTLDQIRMIARGVARVEERDGGFHLLRFTEAQAEAYLATGNRDFYKKTFATAGVRLAFRTDSQIFSFSYRLHSGSSRGYAWFDVYVNGNLTRHFGSQDDDIVQGCAKIKLGVGVKDVEIYLPWSSATVLFDVELDDGAEIEALTRKYSMLCFGDSITQGYDAIYPSLSYVCTVARMLDADVIDKGIGGDTFFPELLDEPDEVTPDIVTVAYGTNDWAHHTREMITEKSRAFYQKLAALYPNAKIFAISPICRMDAENKTKFGSPTYTVDSLIRQVCADLPNVTVLNGWGFTPAHKTFYSDYYLHPNDLGFALYAQNLYREMVRHL